MIRHTVSREEDGMLLRALLKDTLRLSHRTLAALKRKEDGILVNGKHATVRAVLREGDEITLAVFDAEAGAVTPIDIPVDILYEDEHVALCNKPAFMPTHPSFRHHEDTLANALAYRYRNTPYVFRAVNRLDRETDGVVLTAKNAYAAAKLGEAMQSGLCRKEYYAAVCGEAPEKGEITLPIRRRAESIILRETAPDGDAAHTRFERVMTDGKISLLRVFPLTGRTHQIRVHLSAIGHPLCGDALYGEKAHFPRTLLHAHALTFPHPVTGEHMRVEAPFPDDLLALFPFLKK